MALLVVKQMGRGPYQWEAIYIPTPDCEKMGRGKGWAQGHSKTQDFPCGEQNSPAVWTRALSLNESNIGGVKPMGRLFIRNSFVNAMWYLKYRDKTWRPCDKMPVMSRVAYRFRSRFFQSAASYLLGLVKFLDCVEIDVALRSNSYTHLKNCAV